MVAASPIDASDHSMLTFRQLNAKLFADLEATYLAVVDDDPVTPQGIGVLPRSSDDKSSGVHARDHGMTLNGRPGADHVSNDKDRSVGPVHSSGWLFGTSRGHAQKPR